MTIRGAVERLPKWRPGPPLHGGDVCGFPPLVISEAEIDEPFDDFERAAIVEQMRLAAE